MGQTYLTNYFNMDMVPLEANISSHASSLEELNDAKNLTSMVTNIDMVRVLRRMLPDQIIAPSEYALDELRHGDVLYLVRYVGNNPYAKEELLPGSSTDLPNGAKFVFRRLVIDEK